MSVFTTDQVLSFRRSLLHWYKANARKLPWREAHSPYLTWVSEIMLQQTRVNAVLEHYARFVERFPTVISLALAPEDDVLAAWSGLGYYRRARMLHRAAQFLVAELGGKLPHTAAELKRLPGIGEYTSAAIASIAFGETIAVVDGNVERVLLRLTGREEDPTAAGRAFVQRTAQLLVSPSHPGDHNQAMMELGATVCTPTSPRCDTCPVYDLCRTRGEHLTQPRQAMLSQSVAYGVWLRRKQGSTEVLLSRRSKELSLMAGMLELPLLESTQTESLKPTLRLRHSITRTNYYVEIYEMNSPAPAGNDLTWIRSNALRQHPLTGLAKKTLERMGIMESAIPNRSKRKRA